MTDTPETTIEHPPRCIECKGPLDGQGTCLTSTCFRYRPPDGEPIKVDPDIGRFHRGATLEPSPDPVPPGKPICENPKHAALREVLLAIEDLSTADARMVLTAAHAQLDLN